MRAEYTQFRGVPGVGSYLNNKWQLVNIGQWIEYVCGVKSETISLNRRVDLRCVQTKFLSKEILDSIHQARFEFESCISGYIPLTQYRQDSLCIHVSSKIYCTRSVWGVSRSWQWFSLAIDSKLFNIIDWVNILNSFGTLVYSAPEIDKQQMIGIKVGSSGIPENMDLVGRFRNHNFTLTIKDSDQQRLQHRQIPTRENTALQNFT